MQDKYKTKRQLIKELEELRQQLFMVKESRDNRKQIEEGLRSSEKRLELIGKIAYDVLYEWTIANDKVEWFSNIDEILGYKHDEIPRTIEGWLELIHPEDMVFLRDAVEHHRTSNEPISYEYRVKHKNGTWRYWSDRGLPMQDECGSLYKWVGVCTDITERKQLDIFYQGLEDRVEQRTVELRSTNKQLREEIARRKKSEEELRESEERYRQLIETANDAIFIADTATGIIVNANKKAEELLGKPLEEILGMHQTQFHSKEDADHYGRVFKEHVQRGKGVIVEDVMVCHKNGQKIPTEVSASVTKFRGKSIIQGIFRDTSQWKKTEKELKNARDFLSNILESSLDAIVVTDDKGYIIMTNKAFLHLVSFKRKEVVGKHMSEFAPMKEGTYESVTGERIEIDKKFSDHIQYTMTRFAEQEKMRNALSYYLRKDNKVVPVEDSMVFLFDNQRRKIGAVAIIRDITEREKIEKVIKEGKEFLENVIENSRDGIAIVDEKGYIRSVNTALIKMCTFTKEELIGQHASILTIEDKDLRKKILEKAGELFEQGFTSYEAKHKAREGGYLDVECNISMIKDDEGNYIAGVAIIRNITDRKRAEEALRKSEEKYYNLIEHANDAIVSVNRDGMIIGFNKKAEEIFGYPREELLGKPAYLLAPLKKRDDQKKIFGQYRENGRIDKSVIEGLGLRKNGQEFFSEFSFYSLDLYGESIATAIIRDITERKEAEEKLIHNQEQLRSLAAQVTKVEEQERRNIASYLHDHLGQELFAMKLQLEQMKKSLTSTHTIKDLKNVIARTNQMISDMRSMSHELSPPILYELGLEAALEWIIEEMRTILPITITFHDDGQAKPLDETTKILLFQVVRELLNNVTRHAKAQNVEVFVARDNAMVAIQVNDDGIGFEGSEADVSREKTQGFGLYSIKERLRYIGGDLAVESALNSGARITLKAPLKS
jgi:PAS domain S-box-containing protein